LAAHLPIRDKDRQNAPFLTLPDTAGLYDFTGDGLLRPTCIDIRALGPLPLFQTDHVFKDGVEKDGHMSLVAIANAQQISSQAIGNVSRQFREITIKELYEALRSDQHASVF